MAEHALVCPSRHTRVVLGARRHGRVVLARRDHFHELLAVVLVLVLGVGLWELDDHFLTVWVELYRVVVG